MSPPTTPLSRRSIQRIDRSEALARCRMSFKVSRFVANGMRYSSYFLRIYNALSLFPQIPFQAEHHDWDALTMPMLKVSYDIVSPLVTISPLSTGLSWVVGLPL